MYLKWNDDELVYLIRDGLESARKVLYEKYGYLIYKFYSTHRLQHLYTYADFLQEGLLSLEIAIKKYPTYGQVKFYTYFLNCLRNRYHKILSKKNIAFHDKIQIYEADRLPAPTKMNPWIEKYMEKFNPVERGLYQYCILGGGKLSVYCRQNNLNYYKTYRIYQKMRLDLEKILTN